MRGSISYEGSVIVMSVEVRKISSWVLGIGFTRGLQSSQGREEGSEGGSGMCS